jgi:hypothetical protein
MSQNETDVGMMSFPSMGAFIFDVPEPGVFTGQFIYNSYMTNERSSTDSYMSFDPLNPGANRDARYIQLMIEPPSLSNIGGDAWSGSGTETIELSSGQKAALVETYIGTANSEHQIQGNCFSTLVIEDSEISSDVTSAIIEAAATQRGLTTLGISEALSLMSTTSDTLDVDSLMNAAEISAGDNYAFYNPSDGTEVVYSQTEENGQFSLNFAINNKFLADILKSSESAALSPLFGKINSDITTAESTQASSRTTQDSSILTMEQYMPTLTTFAEGSTDTSGTTFLPGLAFLGYIVEKNQVTESGETLITTAYLDSYFGDTTESTTAELNDYKVLYGATYSYSIRTLYLLRYNEYASGGSATVKYAIVKSRSAPKVVVKCEEKLPPSPPNGIEFIRQNDQSIQLFWTPAANVTGDVVKFQIFRRKTIEEPFTLIMEKDFDYTEEQVSSPETIPNQNIVKEPWAICNYIDYEFDNFSEYIYAVCAIDSHHLSSNYSPQFKVKYDKTIGTLDIKLISAEGAPKPYPNFLLPNILFEDGVKDSLHKYLDIYFSPDYYRINDGDGSTASDTVGDYKFIPFVNTENVGGIRMQIINLDRQNSKNVHIILKNEREYDDTGTYTTTS